MRTERVLAFELSGKGFWEAGEGRNIWLFWCIKPVKALVLQLLYILS